MYKKRGKTKTQSTTRAIETIETIDTQHHLVPDETLPIAGLTRVRVSHLLPEDSDVSETEWLQAAAANPAFDFLKDLEGDIYALSDGRSMMGVMSSFVPFPFDDLLSDQGTTRGLNQKNSGL